MANLMDPIETESLASLRVALMARLEAIATDPTTKAREVVRVGTLVARLSDQALRPPTSAITEAVTAAERRYERLRRERSNPGETALE